MVNNMTGRQYFYVHESCKAMADHQTCANHRELLRLPILRMV
jgi:hypothetical protein